MTLYQLAKVNENGDEILKGIFDSEEALLAAIPLKPVLQVEHGRIRLVITRENQGGLADYRVSEITVNEYRTSDGVIDLPDFSLTVRSTTFGGVFYGVSTHDGVVNACTCPAFQYAKTDEPCKHMLHVQENPAQYGLLNPLQAVSASPLPGSFFVRYPSGR